jgi:hypothetical protein
MRNKSLFSVLFTAATVLLGAVVVGALDGADRSAAEGIVLTRNLPPTVDLANKRIALEVSTTNNIPSRYLETLKTRLAAGIQADKRFIIDSVGPATIVRLSATRLAITKNDIQMQIKGTDTKVTRVEGDLQVSFQALDAVTKEPLDSGNLQSVLQRNYYQISRGGLLAKIGDLAHQPLSEEKTFDLLVTNLILQITRRMAQTRETINVGRPDGELKKFRDKAQSRAWVSLYDDLSDMTVFKDDYEKSQREYWMGVAKEAEAYETADRAQARSELVVAARHYDQAFKLKPDESMYMESKHRAEESTVLLAGATPTATPTQVSDGAARPAGGNSGALSAPGPGDDVMTNDVVIYLLNSGMTPDGVIKLIKDTEKTRFDVGFQALGRLSSSKVPDNVIQAMRERAKGQ